MEDGVTQNVDTGSASATPSEPIAATGSFNAAQALAEFRGDSPQNQHKTPGMDTVKGPSSDQTPAGDPMVLKKQDEKKIERERKLEDAKNAELGVQRGGEHGGSEEDALTFDEEKEKENESAEESLTEEDSQDAEDGKSSADDASGQEDLSSDDGPSELSLLSNELKELKDQLANMNKAKEEADLKAREAEYQSTIKKDLELTENPFSMQMTPDEVSNLLDSQTLDAFADNPEMLDSTVNLMNAMLNSFVEKMTGYQESLTRVNEYNEHQAKMDRMAVAKELESRGVDLSVFKQDAFQKFESNPKNKAILDGFEKRFGFDSVEYAHHVYDAFQESTRKSRADKETKAREDAKRIRAQIAEKQAEIDASKVNGGKVPATPEKGRQTIQDRLASWRNGR